MLYTITGWNLKDNGACTLSALLASYNALQRKRSTLLFQLTNPREISLENILIGKQLMDSRLDILDTVVFDDVGIDALLRMSKTQDLDQEAFQQAVTPIREGVQRLDMLKGSMKQDFELETMENFDVVIQALTAAQEVYDDVFILLPEENRPLCINFYENVDGAINIRCLPQRVPDRLVKQKDFIFVLMDYEPESIFTARVIRKAIGLKTIYYFLHNVHLNDAAIQGTLLSFVEKNVNDSAQNDNFPLFDGIGKFLDSWKEGRQEESGEEELQERPACYRLIESSGRKKYLLARVDNKEHVRMGTTKAKFLHPAREYMQVNLSGFDQKDASDSENESIPSNKDREADPETTVHKEAALDTADEVDGMELIPEMKPESLPEYLPPVHPPVHKSTTQEKSAPDTANEDDGLEFIPEEELESVPPVHPPVHRSSRRKKSHRSA